MGDYSNAAMATEMNNTEITNVYFIATFFNCQEEKLDKENADEVRKSYLKM